MNLRGEYIEISSEEEMQKATNWLTSLGYINPHLDPQINKETFVYLFIGIDKHFHFNDEPEKSSHWKPFSLLYEEGMPRDEEEDLLSKAKRLYPIGTQYKCANNLRTETFTVEDINFRKFSNAIDFIGKGFIYHSGKWAEIVHEVKPIVQEKYKYEVVHCTTQEEWNFVAKTLKRTSSVAYKQFGDCIVITSPNSSLTYTICLEEKYKIYSFSEWCEKFGHKPHKKEIKFEIGKWSAGTYVVFFNNSTLHGVKLGTIDKIKYNLDSSKDSFFVDFGCCDRSRLDVDVKWFATLEGAEVFSKSLQLPKKDHNPEYVKLVNMDFWKEGYRDLKLGTIYKWSHLTSGIIASLNSDYWDKWTKEFEISTKEAYYAQQNQLIHVEVDKTQGIKSFTAMSKDELLEYAKKKYPIGTNVKSLVTCIREQIIIDHNTFYTTNKEIWFKGDKKENILVYDNGNWAEILELPNKTEKYNRGNIGSNISSTTYSYNGVKSTLEKMYPELELTETHQLINKRSKFSPIKAELIKLKQLKIKK